MGVHAVALGGLAVWGGGGVPTVRPSRGEPVAVTWVPSSAAVWEAEAEEVDAVEPLDVVVPEPRPVEVVPSFPRPEEPWLEDLPGDPSLAGTVLVWSSRRAAGDVEGAAAEEVVEPALPAVPAAAEDVPAGSRAAELVVAPTPSYPRASARLGEEGEVLCRLFVEPDGSVGRVDVLASSGYPRLDQAAREGLLGWRFEPARRGGLAVPSSLDHTVVFRLVDS